VPKDKSIVSLPQVRKTFASAVGKKHLRHTVPPRKIRRRRTQNLKNFQKVEVKAMQLIPAIDLMNGKIAFNPGDAKTAKSTTNSGPVETQALAR
jgi:hypothetical protein